MKTDVQEAKETLPITDVADLEKIEIDIQNKGAKYVREHYTNESCLIIIIYNASCRNL